METTDEPIITINGRLISPAEAMTIRVAIENFYFDLVEDGLGIENFYFDLVEDGLGDDDHGKKITELYKESINKIRYLIFNDRRLK